MEVSYVDNWGATHQTAPEVQQGILRALGLDATSLDALNQAEELALWKRWTRLIDSTVVTSRRPIPGAITLRIPLEQIHERVELLVRLEDGRLERRNFTCSSLQVLSEAELRGRHLVCLQIPLFDELPLGYHQLTVRVGAVDAAMSLIITPDQSWMPEQLRTAGIAISLYGLKSKRNWGSGDTTDLLEFGLWAHRALGVSFVGLNPLHAIHNRQPFNTSPYLPLSAYLRNPLYIDVERLTEYQESGWADALTRSNAVQNELAALRESEYVEYERAWRLKKVMLRLAHRQLERSASTRREIFNQYCAEAAAERRQGFATFCALDEAIHLSKPAVWLFTEWPTEYQDRHSEAVREFALTHARSIRFHLYLQWVLDEQLSEVQQELLKAGMALGLYHDLALASDRYGFDAWYEPAAFAAGVRVGSPPDGFSPEGQDWAFPPPSPSYGLDDGYAAFRELIRANARHGGALRFDHVMRFFRLYWIPAQLTAREGAYVGNDAEALLRIISLESVRGHFLVIGEDLGTVTPKMREMLDRFGILGYRLLIFERDHAGFRAAELYPVLAAASVTTHDLPTLTGFLTGADIEARRSAGLLPDIASYENQWKDRREALADLRRLLEAGEDALSPEDLVKRVFRFLVAAKSRVFIINQEELTGEQRQQNLPGSTAEYPNWRRKMKIVLEDLGDIKPLSDWIKRQLEESGRA